MIDPYIAHGKQESAIIQSVSQHAANVACLAEKNCSLASLKEIVWLTGIFHDAGKYQDAYQKYIKKAMLDADSVVRGSVDHATGGGQLIEQMMLHSPLAEIIEMAIYCHHGLYDCFSLENGEPLISKRLAKTEESQMVAERFFQFFPKEELLERSKKAAFSLKEIMVNINRFIKNASDAQDMSIKKSSILYGNRDFFLGMYQRLLLSLLIDADRTDTADFMQREDLKQKNQPVKMPKTDQWVACLSFFEQYLKKMTVKTRLDGYRQAISLKCQMAARSPQRLYRLTVPTGAGKTLSSLRYALSHAQEYGKEHIIYIAPYNSILEQNAQAIRQALGETAIILEHHCNVIHQNDEAQEEYDLLAENWQAMIVVTTAVQFLNTLFSAQSGSVRRMHNLCNSIIIFDEIQALPIRIMKIFNLAVNFLTAFCNTTIVLCSATQPLLDKFPENRILPAQEMADDFSLYAAAFQRTTIIDQTRLKNGGLNIAELAEFVLAKQKNAQQVLVVVNTRSCAVNLYEELKQKTAEQFMEADLRENGCKLFHLSNNMCMSNRQEVLEEVKSSLAQEKPLICVSTALIEAGVDISFKSVIRSLIGLDSIIQAAGRCNRNGRDENGNVYIVHISREAENVSRMADISQAQGIMQTVLNRFAAMPEIFDHSLSSKQAIDFYYELYLSRRRAEMDYPVALAHGQSSLLELLSGNKQQWHSFHGQGGGPLLKQAFKTAGSLFEVIAEDGKIDIIVPYNKEAEQLVAALQDVYRPIWAKKADLNKLQSYTVGISQSMLKVLDNAITKVWDGRVLLLDKAYYSYETGVSDLPVSMGNIFL